MAEQTKPKKPTEEQLRESLRAAAAAVAAPNSFEVNAKAEHARNPVRDFFDDADLRAKMNHSPHVQDRKAARAELVARRAKEQVVATQQASRRPARKASEWAAWFRGLTEGERDNARDALRGRDSDAVSEIFDRVEREELESEFGTEYMTAMTEETSLGQEPAAGETPFRFFESPDPEQQAAFDLWLDDDSGFIEEPGAEDERSLGEVYDDEYVDALAEYGDVA
jgi:hypothetical protein